MVVGRQVRRARRQGRSATPRRCPVLSRHDGPGFVRPQHVFAVAEFGITPVRPRLVSLSDAEPDVAGFAEVFRRVDDDLLACLKYLPGDVFDEQVDFPGQVFRVGQVVTDRRRPFRAEGSDVDGQLRASPRFGALGDSFFHFDDFSFVDARGEESVFAGLAF